MTTTHPHATSGIDRGWPTYAALGVAIAVALTAFGTFTNLTGEAEEGGHTVREYLVVVAIIAIGALVVFGLVARVVTPANAGTFGVGFGLVGLLSVLVFWTGLPAVLAAGAVAAAAVDARSGAMSLPAKVGVGLAVLTLLPAVSLAIWG